MWRYWFVSLGARMNGLIYTALSIYRHDIGGSGQGSGHAWHSLQGALCVIVSIVHIAVEINILTGF